MKNILATLVLVIAAATASASSLGIVAGTAQSVAITGFYNPSPNVTGTTYTTGTLGQIEALSAGVFTATYLGQESGYNNGFFLEWVKKLTLTRKILNTNLESASNAMGGYYDVVLNEKSGVGDSISANVNAGELDFWFKDSKGGWVGNDGKSHKKARFAILEQGKCLTTYGCFDFILGFDDSGGGLDADFDDFVVGISLTPVPLPAAAWLFGSALLGFITLSNRRRV